MSDDNKTTADISPPADGAQVLGAASPTPITKDAAPISSASPVATKDADVVRTAQEWRVVGDTVPGASHLRAGIPNQDALLHTRASSVGAPVILSVSDGHGSNKCFRSDRGSRIAVHLAVELMSETLNDIYNGARDASDLAKFEAESRARLGTELVNRWRAVVEADFKREPFKESEMERMIAKDGERARAAVEANPHLVYGATLLVVALTDDFIISMQLGDGEIILVADNGVVTSPLPEDVRLLANETTSLCLAKAAEDFRFGVRPLGLPAPALVLLTTDGYYNSFSTTAGFHQVGADLIEMMRTDGFDSVNRSVKGWLAEATQAGSGDDCTLAFIVRMDAIAQKSVRTPAATTTATTSAPATTAPAASVPPAPHEQLDPPKTA